MIKHIILAADAGIYVEHAINIPGEAGFLADSGTALMLKENDTNGSLFSIDLSFKYKNMVTVFPLPPKRKDFLSVTCYPLSDLVKGGVRTNVIFTPNDSFNIPNKTFENGMIVSSTIDTEGKIIPGVYGFMLVKKNVNFNVRNKWYIEVIVKEDTTYADFADILDAKFKDIDDSLSLTFSSNKFTLATSNVTDKAYDLMFDDLSTYAFTKVSSNGVNNRARHFLRKLCREADANYGFNYTTVEGTELYKNRTDETFKLLEEAVLSSTPGTLYALNIKFNEPSYYRTVDEKVNKVITIIANYIVIETLIIGLGLTLDNNLSTKSVGTKIDGRMVGDLNNDGVIDIDDVNIMIDVMIKKASIPEGDKAYYDTDDSGAVDLDDLNAVINYIIHKTDDSVSKSPLLSRRFGDLNYDPSIVTAITNETPVSSTYIAEVINNKP